MVIVPLREVGEALAVTLKPRDPFPLPLGVVVKVIHGTPLLAVQPHPAGTVIDTMPVPPAAGVETDVGCSVTEQLGEG